MSEKTRLKCECCGFEEDLTSDEAFEKGWDAPPHFTQIVTCPLCPSSGVLLRKLGKEPGATHEVAHADWARNGRPDLFGPRCFLDDDIEKLQ